MANGRHRAQPVPGYPWLRAAGTVGLATLVPVTGAWVAVGDIGIHVSGPSTSQSATGHVVAAGRPDHVPQTDSATVVLSRSPSPSLDALARSGRRMSVDTRQAEPKPARITVQTGTTAQPLARHRAEPMPGASPTPAVAGRHRADAEDDRSTGPSPDADADQGGHAPPDNADHDNGEDSHTGGSGGSEDGEAGESGSSHGNGNAYGHAHSQSRGDSDGDGGSEDEAESDSHGNGNAYGHDESASSGHGGQGNGQGNGHGNDD